MRKCLEDDKESVQLILSIILRQIKGLKVTEVKTEREILSLSNRSITLDVYAVDDSGKLYDIEIQRDDKGATGKRARYNGTLMDLDFLKKGNDFKDLPTRYVIVISKNGFNCHDKPLQDYVYTSQDGNYLDDETHVVYVNGKNKEDTELGHLMQDFNNKDYNTMFYKQLADKVRYYKTTEKGNKAMNEKLEKIIDERLNALLSEKIKSVFNIEKVEYFSNLLKMGLKETDIQKALKISDTDYNIIYPLALKLAQ